MDAPTSWTAADQQRADTFEAQIVPLQCQLRGGHPDVIVVAFAQALRSLMAARLLTAPDALTRYANLLAWIRTEVEAAAVAGGATASA